MSNPFAFSRVCAESRSRLPSPLGPICGVPVALTDKPQRWCAHDPNGTRIANRGEKLVMDPMGPERILSRWRIPLVADRWAFPRDERA
jgi:hypothetical protein